MKTIKSQILDFVESKGTVTRNDIVRFYVESIKGRIFDHKKDRNVLTIALATPGPEWPKWDTRGYLRKPGRGDSRRLHKIGYNTYTVVSR